MDLPPLLQVLKNRKPAYPRPPVWLMRQAGRYLPEYRSLRHHCPDFIQFCLTPDLTVEATLQPLRRYDLNAAILFSDILIVPYALGQSVSFVAGKGPQLRSIRSSEDLSQLSLEGFLERLSPVFETLRQLRTILPPEKTLIGFAGAPWTLFAYMVEGRGSRTFSQAIHLCYQEQKLTEKLCHLICEATKIYLKSQIEAGAQVIQLFDSWAGVVPFPLLDSLVYQPTRHLVQFLREEAPDVPVICFPKGLGEKLPVYVQKTQTQALSLDAFLDLGILLPHLPSDLVLQGGLDPQVLVVGGQRLNQEVDRLKRTFYGRSYIFNLGHGIVPETPPEHVDLLINLLNQEI